MSQRKLVIDLGADEIRAATDNSTQFQRVSNCVGVRTSGHTGAILGDALHRLSDYHHLLLRRPLEMGLLVDVDLQARILEELLYNKLRLIPGDEPHTDVLLTLPFGIPHKVCEALVQLLFEAFSFRRVSVVSSPFLSLCSTSTKGCGIVLDAGFSFSTIAAYHNWRMIARPVRVDVGGKLLSNRLKELISYSQVNLLEETWLVNHLKEQYCFVSEDFRRDLAQAPSMQKVKHILPTVEELGALGCVSTSKPHLAFDVQITTVSLKHERFVVPELLFSPSDVGIQQCGISEGIFNIINQIGRDRPWLCAPLASQITFSGGCSNLPGFTKRVIGDVQSSVPSYCVVGSSSIPSSVAPQHLPIEGGLRLLHSELPFDFKDFEFVDRSSNLERGAGALYSLSKTLR